jgi:long-subunit acyl-CoA synthetase (AMP-forming)
MPWPMPLAPGASSRATASRCWRRIAGSGQWWTSLPWCWARRCAHLSHLTADQIALLLIDSGARIAVVSTEAQYQKDCLHPQPDPARAHRRHGRDRGLEKPPPSRLCSNAAATQPRSICNSGCAVSQVKPEDLATLIYTSGTTGEPKGVMLTHGNIASNLNYSTRTFAWDPTPPASPFCPLSHITARHLDYALFCYGATLAYCGNFDRLPAALTAVQPTVFVAVPRVYEKIREVVERRAGSKPMVKKLFTWALATGRRHREKILLGQTPSSLRWRLADRLVFQESQAGVWRQGARLHRWGSTAWLRHSGLVCRCRHSHLRRLRPHRNLARAGPEQCAKSSHRLGGQADRVGGMPLRSRW